MHALMHAETVVVGAVAIVAVVLAVTVAMLARIVGRSSSSVARITAAASVVALVVLSPLAVDILVTSLNPARGLTYAMIDPGWAAKLGPAIIAATVATVIIVRTRTRDANR
jgi:hypothetical protein